MVASSWEVLDSTGLSPSLHVALFTPGIKATTGCCSLADHTHTVLAEKVGNTVLQLFSVSLTYLFRSLSLHCYPVSFSINPPIPSTFPRHHFSSSCPSGYRNSQNLRDKALLSFHPFSKRNNSFPCSTEKVRFLLHSSSSGSTNKI